VAAVSSEEVRVRIFADRCAGHAMCTLRLPQRIALDEWGYPVIDPSPVGPELARRARHAVAACPVGALWLESGAPDPSSRKASSTPVQQPHFPYVR
jgi:ferredoxin